MWQWVIIGVAALLGGFLLLVAWCSLVVGARADEEAERLLADWETTHET